MKSCDYKTGDYSFTLTLMITWLLLICYRSDQLSDTKDSVAEIEKCVESDHCGSGNDPDTVDDNNQPSDSMPSRVC